MCPEIFFHSPVEIQATLGLTPISAFWDDAIVSMAMSLPTHLKLRKGITKYILRKAASLNFHNEYWMLPKIGLQSSYSYVVQSEEGKNWRNKMDEEITSSPEYKHLKELVPDGIVDTTKLLNLIVWKKNNCETIA